MTKGDILLVETSDFIFSYQISDKGNKAPIKINKKEYFKENFFRFVWDDELQAAFAELKEPQKNYINQDLLIAFDDKLSPISLS